MPGVLLSVQAPEQEDGSVSGVDVEHAVHVRAAVNRVPARSTVDGIQVISCQSFLLMVLEPSEVFL